ncbi:hypothetical protein EVA_20935 [gut metagenome]|uniref:Lipoprotein n=1 Tax=gut metagenome TaxID=749906 RepID=J9F942_9ZZZZ
MKATYWTIFFVMFLLTACQLEESLLPEPNDRPHPEPMASIVFQFHPSADTRTTGNDNEQLWEEGQVDDLLYAIFQNGTCRRIKHDPLEGETSGNLHTCTSPQSSYTVQDIPAHWLNSQTEIFAVANANDALREQLLNGTYTITDDNPFLVERVEKQLDSLARAKGYDLLIQRQYQQATVPTDGKVHYLPADKNHYKNQTWTLEEPYRFRTYAEFRQKKEDPTLPVEMRKLYEQIATDLQCRLQLYQTDYLKQQLTQLQQQEEQNHAIRNHWQNDAGFQRYLLWKTSEHTADLNKTASQSLTCLLPQPLMAGYYALKDNYPTEIKVPVEHAYSRIWFAFQWDALKEAESIIVDSITLSGLLNQSQLFNTEEDRIQNNPAQPKKVSYTLRNTSDPKTAQPFFGCLGKEAYPYHLGDSPRMYFDQQHNRDYGTICRYQRKTDHSTDKQQPPIRYYVYSFQWGGNAPEDDPLLTVYYHFTKTVNESGSHAPVIYKKATARLYDETHRPGKSHHGLLRNFTYQVNGVVTTLTNTLSLQITAISWHRVTVDDIPPFE